MVVGLLLVGMIGTATLVVAERLTPRPAIEIHTRMESGKHLVFVLIAPTSAWDQEYIAQVVAARQSLEETAREKGYLYSTVGVSDAWNVDEGLAILRAFGPFDEVVVGRNWLNTGVKAYLTDFGAKPAVPQVVVLLHEIRLDDLSTMYRDRRELIRAIGPEGMAEWERGGFAVSVRSSQLRGSYVSRADRSHVSSLDSLPKERRD